MGDFYKTINWSPGMEIVVLLRAQVAQEGVEPPVEWVVVFGKHSQVPLSHLPSQDQEKKKEALKHRTDRTRSSFQQKRQQCAKHYMHR